MALHQSPHISPSFSTSLLLLFTLFLVQLPLLSFAHPFLFTCGEHVFDYPFGFNNSGHGDLSLQINCDYDQTLPKPVLDISGKKYYILLPKAYFFTHIMGGIMTIIDKELRDNCDPSSNNYTELRSSSQFHIADTHIDISLGGHCKPGWTDLPNETAGLICNRDWHYNLTTAVNWTELCRAQVVLPLNSSGGPVDDHQILCGGFPIKWNLSQRCRDCQISGGHCGYGISMEFHCKCRHIPYPDICPADNKSSIGLTLGLSIGGAALVAAVVLLLVYIKRRQYPRRGLPGDLGDYERNELEVYRQQYVDLTIFAYEELKWATNFFNERNRVGDGGFGSVYFGKLGDGRDVAVKKLYQQNCKSVEQFINEVQILSRLKHPNLVDLYGCSDPGSPVLLLVYEFMANGTLADHLHGSRRTPKGLPWETRLNIAVGTARALAFLHSLHPPILHRDVKSTNILLDENFGAKVADMGLSRLLPVNVSHITTAPQGTPGYIDPNYHECFQLTDKSDVYSFGVVLVEIISSKVAVDTSRSRNEIILAVMASDKIRRGALDEILDPDLKIGMREEVKLIVSAVAELAFRCLASDRNVRPDMKEVSTRLEEIKQHQQSLA